MKAQSTVIKDFIFEDTSTEHAELRWMRQTEFLNFLDLKYFL